MKSFIAGMLITSSAFAGTANFQITNFNFDYKNPMGEGAASSFSGVGNTDGKVHLRVEKIDKDFDVVVSGSQQAEYMFKGAPSFMTEAELMELTNLNVSLNENLKINLTQGSFTSIESNLILNDLNVVCEREIKVSEVMDQVLAGCTQEMSFTSSKFTSAAVEEVLLRSISEAAPGLKINSVSFTINGGKFYLSAEVKAQVSGKVKSYGSISYEASSGKLAIKISEVKFSVMNVTGKVFDELRKHESEKLKVNEPYVYYQMK
jgi:hypothetical protein